MDTNETTAVVAEHLGIQGQGSAASRRMLIGLLAGAAAVALDFFIVLACLPSIERALDASHGQLQLVMAAFAIANGSFLVVGGRLGDVFGRRRLFLIGLALFAAASAACGLATSATALIAYRALQGLAGAMLQPQVLGLLSVNFDSKERPRVFGLYAAALGCAGIAAQLIGGTLVEFLPLDLGWRACFLIVVPVCLLAGALAASARDTATVSHLRVDIGGAALLAAALGGVGAFLTVGRDAGWPVWSWLALLVGAVCGMLFWIWQRIGHVRGRERIVPGGMLANNGFGLSLLAILVFYCGVASFYFVMALELRGVAGYSAIQVALMFAWMGAWFVGVSTSAPVRQWLGGRWVVFGVCGLGLGHTVMSFGLLQAGGDRQLIMLLAAGALQGAGLGMLMGPLVSNAIVRVAKQHSSVGGGVASATQQIGNSLGVTAIGFAYFGDRGDGVQRAVMYLLFVLAVLALALRASRRPGID
jgi:MFS family permease